MNSYRQWVVLFGGHRRRGPECPTGCLQDTALLDTEAMAWEPLAIEGELPKRRGNHAAAVLSDR
eukprot:1000778-Prymnesium_polylepis.1